MLNTIIFRNQSVGLKEYGTVTHTGPEAKLSPSHAVYTDRCPATRQGDVTRTKPLGDTTIDGSHTTLLRPPPPLHTRAHLRRF